MRKGTKWLLLGGSAGIAAAAGAAYGLIARPWHLRWGATREEVAREMPFDRLIARPNYFATRAVTIEATPEQVWPFVIDTRTLPNGTLIRHVEEKKAIVFAPPEEEAEATWVVTLEELPRGRTRVVSRNRARFGRHVTSVLRYLLVDPGQFVLERNWLNGVKRRAEAEARKEEAMPDLLPEPSAPAPRVAAPPVVEEEVAELVGAPD